MSFEDDLRTRFRGIERGLPGRPLDWDQTVERLRLSRNRRVTAMKLAAVGVLAAGGVSGVAAMSRLDYLEITTPRAQATGSPAPRTSGSASIGAAPIAGSPSRAPTGGRAKLAPLVTKGCSFAALSSRVIVGFGLGPGGRIQPLRHRGTVPIAACVFVGPPHDI
jgi:hypothetical protein